MKIIEEEGSGKVLRPKCSIAGERAMSIGLAVLIYRNGSVGHKKPRHGMVPLFYVSEHFLDSTRAARPRAAAMFGVVFPSAISRAV